MDSPKNAPMAGEICDEMLLPVGAVLAQSVVRTCPSYHRSSGR